MLKLFFIENKRTFKPGLSKSDLNHW